MKERKRSNGGFTLLEVIVVLGIIGIAMAIAVPGFLNWLPNYRLRAATGDLLTNLQRARVEAVKRNASCVVRFNNPVGYAAFVDDDNNGAFDPGETLLATVRWADYPGVALDGTPTNGGVIRFNIRGQPMAAGISVDLQSSRGDRRGVRVNLLGNARIVQL